MATRTSASSSSRTGAVPSTQDTQIRHEDHRKRKRNRTSKSCINCRMAKRQCDRQRPACQRCVSLGLTGLCAFEVDDTPASSDPLDENARLRRRIAELERVIRELQKKPHPRWAPSGVGTETTLSSVEKSPDLTPNDPDPESSGGITLTLPFGTAESQSSDVASTGESITSSSGTSTPVEVPTSWALLHGRPQPPALPHHIQEEWYRVSNQSSAARTQMPQSSLTESAGLGYNDHQFVQRHPNHGDISMIEYPGAPTRPQEVADPRESQEDDGNAINNKPTYRYPQWPTISLGDDT